MQRDAGSEAKFQREEWLPTCRTLMVPVNVNELRVTHRELTVARTGNGEEKQC